VPEHRRGHLDPELAPRIGDVHPGAPTRDRRLDRSRVVSKRSWVVAGDGIVFVQLHVEIDVAVDRVDGADAVEYHNLILPILVVVNIAQRDLWPDWRFRAVGVISHKRRLEIDIFPYQEVHSRRGAKNVVPIRVPRNIHACINESDIHGGPICGSSNAIKSKLIWHVILRAQPAKIRMTRSPWIFPIGVVLREGNPILTIIVETYAWQLGAFIWTHAAH